MLVQRGLVDCHAAIVETLRLARSPQARSRAPEHPDPIGASMKPSFIRGRDGASNSESAGIGRGARSRGR